MLSGRLRFGELLFNCVLQIMQDIKGFNLVLNISNLINVTLIYYSAGLKGGISIVDTVAFSYMKITHLRAATELDPTGSFKRTL